MIERAGASAIAPIETPSRILPQDYQRTSVRVRLTLRLVEAPRTGALMLKDLRHAAKMLRHAKGWTVVVVLSLALGIGANTALFSAINGLLLEQVPVRDPGSLARFRHAGPNDMATSSSDYGYSGSDASGLDMRATFSYPMYQQFAAHNRTLADL